MHNPTTVRYITGTNDRGGLSMPTPYRLSIVNKAMVEPSNRSAATLGNRRLWMLLGYRWLLYLIGFTLGWYNGQNAEATIDGLHVDTVSIGISSHSPNKGYRSDGYWASQRTPPM